MSIQELFQPNSYDIFANTLQVLNSQTDSFRKGKSNIQNVSPLDPTPRLVLFDTFTGQPFLYSDNSPNNCYTFIDDGNIQINKTGKYLVFAQINAGNETPGSTIIIGVNLQGTLVGQSISLSVQGSVLIPFNNGLHSQNVSLILSSIALLNANEVIQVQYLVSDITDIYPSSFIGLKYLSS